MADYSLIKAKLMWKMHTNFSFLCSRVYLNLKVGGGEATGGMWHFLGCTTYCKAWGCPPNPLPPPAFALLGIAWATAGRRGGTTYLKLLGFPTFGNGGGSCKNSEQTMISGLVSAIFRALTYPWFFFFISALALVWNFHPPPRELLS